MHSLCHAANAKLFCQTSPALILNLLFLQIEVCREQIEWAKQEKRSFLRQRIEMRLATLLIETSDYQGARLLVDSLLTEVKKLDDKLLLVDIHLIESKLHHLLINTPKSKAALTAARAAANSVYVPPSLQVRAFVFVDVVGHTAQSATLLTRYRMLCAKSCSRQYEHIVVLASMPRSSSQAHPL